MIEFLKLIYRGRLKPGSFEKLLGKSFDQIDSGYQSFLKIDPTQLKYLDPRAVNGELALINVRLNEDSLQSLAQLTQLDWLDLSASDVRGDRLSGLKSCTRIDQFFLTAARIDDRTIEVLAELPVIEVDLRGTNLNDDQLLELAKSQSIRSLNVGGTKVTERGLNAFARKRSDIILSIVPDR